MLMLGRDYFNQASDSIMKYGRPLEKALFKQYFEGESTKDILKELKKFQNKDGGFGHGIESDFRLPYSSPMATSVGIRLLSQIDELQESRDMIKAAINYLEAAFDKKRKGWFAVPKEVNEFDHAPWWHYDMDKGMTIIDQNWGNPSAEILAYLYKYKEYVTEIDIDGLIEHSIHYIENKTEFESEHELFCYIKLFEALPGEIKGKLEKRIAYGISQVIEYNCEKWEEYVPLPLDFVPSPEKERFGVKDYKIDENLDYYIQLIENSEDGLISPPWGDEFYQDGLKPAYNEWKGVLTLNALKILDHYNRIEA